MSMIYSDEVEKIMDAFLSNEIGITDRAIRLLKKNNPDRYQRELIGALVLASGHKFNDVVLHFNGNNILSILDDEIKNKISALNVLMKQSPVGDISIQELSPFSITQSKYIKDFLCKFFDGYRGENGEAFSFEFWSWNPRDKKQRPDNYNDLLPILTVLTIDLTCGDFDCIEEEDFTILDHKNQTVYPLTDIIKMILGSEKFKNMKRVAATPYKNTFDIKFKLNKNEACPIKSMVIEFNNWTLSYRVAEGNIYYFNVSIENGDLLYDGDFDDEDLGNVLQLLLVLYEKTTIRDNEDALKTLTKKVLDEMDIFSGEKGEVPDRDDQSVMYLILIEKIVLDSISKGLDKAFNDINYEYKEKRLSYFEKLPLDKDGYRVEKNYTTKTYAVEDLVGCNSNNRSASNKTDENNESEKGENT